MSNQSIAPIYTMSYYGPVDVDPRSELAGILCQEAADIAESCGYPMCDQKAVGCAIHKATITQKKDGKSIYHDNCSKFLPVCEKHKAWEFEKVNPDNIGGWIW